MPPAPNQPSEELSSGPRPADTLVFFVNGKKVEEAAPDPAVTLLSFLRTRLGLTGTKLGCGEGGCGACTVMVSRFNRGVSRLEHISVNACLAPVVSMHGLAVTTVEGIGSAPGRLHAVQARLAAAHGSQCGFCTPGIVMSMYTLLRNKPVPDMEDIDTYFQGNLCRCTGYRPILEGLRSFTDSWAAGAVRQQGAGGCSRADCCKKGGSGPPAPVPAPEQYSPGQEPIFPPALQLDSLGLDSQYLRFEGPRVEWHRPTSLRHLLALRLQHPAAKIVVGNTELGVEVARGHRDYPVYLCPGAVPELAAVKVTEAGLELGAATTLTALEVECHKLAAVEPAWRVRVFLQIKEMLRWFAGKQIRNVAAIGGNIMTGSPISDLNPIFLAAGCTLTLASTTGTRTVPFDENFYTGYRRNLVQPTELLLSILVPFTRENQYFVAYKQARRRDDDIAIVNSAFNVTVSEGRVTGLRMAFGGMAPVTKLGLESARALEGRAWDRGLVEVACSHLAKEFQLPPDVPGGMARYRQSLVLSFFFKFFLTVDRELRGELDASEVSATEVFTKPPIHSHQLYEARAGDAPTDIVGKPLQHRAAEHQVAGTALYLDDLPRLEGELYLGLVLSKKAHARLVRVDPGPALALPGVTAWVDHTSLPGAANSFHTAIRRDELVFARDEVLCQGQLIGGVVARDQSTAQRAARAVIVEYEELPAILTMEQAIAAGSFHPWDNDKIESGDVDAAFALAEHVVTGSIRTGAQDHFYLETQASLVVPGEGDEVTVYASTQNPTLTQVTVASVLGVGAHKVVVKVKRMGGGFGGKESRSVALTAAVAAAARASGRPVRCMLDRDEDMITSGWRHPFLGRYKVAFNSAGLVQAAEVDLYNNAGCTMDLSFSVMERAMFHSDGSYLVPSLRVRGHCCKTNLPSNTAFRGFGGPQGLMVAESWMEKIAETLGLPTEEVRERNLYKEGELTHFNQRLENCTLGRCWQECRQLADFQQLRDQVDHFNATNRWKKRGLAMLPVKFGIAFTAVHLNQNGALLNVYTDGTVLLAHGGTEMGQGLHTKMIQVAAHTLGIDHNKVHILETSTATVPNTPPTAASAGSDLNGMAVLEACNTINARLQKFKTANPGGSWEDWVTAAFFDRVSLSTTGFHATPDIGYNFETNSGNAFNYFTFGVGCSLVEIDCLTGDQHVLRTDIVMDLGESLNPAIDIGQVEGGFMQGYGLFVMEQLLHSPDGALLTKGPGAYKIPSFNDVPAEFNVCLLRGAPNPRAVYSSKAVGEPPLFLAASVFWAIKEAVKAAREAAGAPRTFQLESPATAERIRLACEDSLLRGVAEGPEEGSYRPWALQV